MHTDVRFPWLAPAEIVMSAEEIAHYRQYEAPAHTVTIRHAYTGSGRMVFASCTCGAKSDLWPTVMTPHNWRLKHERKHA